MVINHSGILANKSEKKRRLWFKRIVPSWSTRKLVIVEWRLDGVLAHFCKGLVSLCTGALAHLSLELAVI